MCKGIVLLKGKIIFKSSSVFARVRVIAINSCQPSQTREKFVKVLLNPT